MSVNIVVTCTSRKKHAPPTRLQMRTVRERNIEARAYEWIERLSANSTNQTAAAELYCGEYWSVARALPLLARQSGIAARIWICSAGYGLISFQSHICSYSATFSPFEPDCVTRGFDSNVRAEAAQRWWQLIARWRGPKGSELRSLNSVAQEYPKVPLLVVGSPDYLQSLEQDLTGTVATLASSDLLLIASAGMKAFGMLTNNLLPCDARLQASLGGTRGSLNIRVAKRVVEFMGRGEIGLTRQKGQLQRLLDKQPAIEQYQRRVLTDEEIRNFIRMELDRHGHASKSVLLRKLRDSGRACEQSRFGGLYQQMVTDEKIA